MRSELAGFGFTTSETTEALVQQLQRGEFINDAHFLVKISDHFDAEINSASLLRIGEIKH